MFIIFEKYLRLLIVVFFLIFVSFITCELQYTGYCPEKCVCFHFSTDQPKQDNLTWVNCELRQPSINGYTKLPEKLPNETYALDLTFNNITQLTLTDTLPTLKFLKLSTNNLQTVESNALDNLYNLEALYLSYNNLSRLDSQVFAKLIKLTILDLSHNRFSDLPKEIFKENSPITQLILSHNPLINIFPQWFESLYNLEKLDLSYTQLYSIRPETFHRLTKLRELDLSGNLLTHVPSEGLRPLNNLHTLKLNVNRFKYLNDESFKSLSSLVVLEICSNDLLSRIESRTFSELTNLQNLTIADNHALNYIHVSAFKRMYDKNHFNLLSLDLKRNHLTNLSIEMLPFCQLKSLDLRKNPWNCDCSLSWVVDCESIIGDPRCMNPKGLNGEALHSIHKSEFSCTTNAAEDQARDVKTAKVLILLMAATLLLVLGMSIAVMLKRSDLMKSNVRRGNGSIYYVKAQSAPGYANDVPTGSLI